MNIFYLDHSVIKCAEYHVDKHVRKMIVEYSQLLSTAHRVLDGKMIIDDSSGRRYKRWVFDDSRDELFYKSTHVNHPSAIWVRQSSGNYYWLLRLLEALLQEYEYRFGKTHSSKEIFKHLMSAPKNILKKEFNAVTPAMNPEYIVEDSIQSYRNYYKHEKSRMAFWTKRTQPDWW
jgi:hypothetical protein